jgi:hypothetical protein
VSFQRLWWPVVAFLVFGAATRLAIMYSDGRYGWAVAFGVSLGFILGVVATDTIDRRR